MGGLYGARFHSMTRDVRRATGAEHLTALVPCRKNQRLVIELFDGQLIYVDRQFLQRHDADGRHRMMRRRCRAHGGGCGGGGSDQNYCHKSSNRLMRLHGNLAVFDPRGSYRESASGYLPGSWKMASFMREIVSSFDNE